MQDPFLQEIQELKKEISKNIRLDNEIKADPYSNIARLRTCERIEKTYIKLKNGGNNGTNCNNHR